MIQRFNCTAMICVPSTLQVLDRLIGDRLGEILGGLHFIETASAPFGTELKNRMRSALPEVHVLNRYGSTETPAAIYLDILERPDKLKSIGKPLSHVKVKTIGDERKEIESAPGRPGKLAISGPMIMKGYYGNNEMTASVLEDGWVLSKDLACIDADGYVFLVGREDDIINVGGKKVSPVEVEQAAQEFSKVRECACIGVDDPDGVTGKVPVLYVVSEGKDFRERDLTKFLSERLEQYKLPKRYIQIQALPRNRMEKLDRKALVKIWEETGDMPLTNEVIRCLLERRSIRDFMEKPIPKSYLDVILQTGIHAPSGHNMQTWRFTVLREQDKIQELKKVITKTVEGKKVHFYGFNNPPALILVSNDRRNHNGIQDSSCAAENMMLAAHSFGLGSVWINALSTICNEPEIRELLNSYEIPTRHTVIAMLALGWPKEQGKLLAKKQDVVKWVGDGK